MNILGSYFKKTDFGHDNDSKNNIKNKIIIILSVLNMSFVIFEVYHTYKLQSQLNNINHKIDKNDKKVTL